MITLKRFPAFGHYLNCYMQLAVAYLSKLFTVFGTYVVCTYVCDCERHGYEKESVVEGQIHQHFYE